MMPTTPIISNNSSSTITSTEPTTDTSLATQLLLLRKQLEISTILISTL